MEHLKILNQFQDLILETSNEDAETSSA